MSERLNPQLVARLGDQTYFSRALVDAGMCVGVRKPHSGLPPAILWADARHTSLNRALRALRQWRGAEAEPIKGEGFSVYLNGDVATSGDAWVARGYDAWFLHKRFHGSKRMRPAGKIFDIRQGIRLGSDVFVVSKDYVQQLTKSKRRFFRPAVMNPSINNGQLNDDHYVFYHTVGPTTSKNRNGTGQACPSLFRRLPGTPKKTLAARKTLERQTSKVVGLTLASSLAGNAGAKNRIEVLWGPEIFAFDRSGDFVVVVGNAWSLKKGNLEPGVEARRAPTLPRRAGNLLCVPSVSQQYACV